MAPHHRVPISNADALLPSTSLGTKTPNVAALHASFDRLRNLFHSSANILYRELHKPLLTKTVQDDSASSLTTMLFACSRELVETIGRLTAQTLLVVSDFYDAIGDSSQVAKALQATFILDEVAVILDERLLHDLMSRIFSSRYKEDYLSAIQWGAEVGDFLGRLGVLSIEQRVESSDHALASEEVSNQTVLFSLANNSSSAEQLLGVDFVGSFRRGNGQRSRAVFQEFCRSATVYCERFVLNRLRQIVMNFKVAPNLAPPSFVNEEQAIRLLRVLISELCHALKHDALIHNQRHDFNYAATSINSLLTLDKYANCLSNPEKEQLLATFVRSKGRRFYFDSIEAMRPLLDVLSPDFLDAKIQEIEEWPRQMQLALNAQNHIEACIDCALHIKAACDEYGPLFSAILRGPVFDTFFVLSKKRSELRKRVAAKREMEGLSWAMLLLNQILRNMPNVTLETRLEDIYFLYRIFRQSVLHHELGGEEIDSALRQAINIARTLLAQREHLMDGNNKRKFHLYSRVGELCHAQLQYRYASSADSPNIMKMGIAALQEALKFTGTSTRQFHMYEMLGDCECELKEWESAIESYEHAFGFGAAADKDADRRISLRMADCHREIHRSRMRDAPDEARASLVRAEEFVNGAARLLDPLEDLSHAPARHIKNIDLHARLAALALEGGDFPRTEKQATLYLGLLSSSTAHGQDESAKRRVQSYLGTAYLRQRKTQEGIAVFESLLKDETSQTFRLRYLRSLRALFFQVADYERAADASSQLLDIAGSMGYEFIKSLTHDQRAALIHWGMSNRAVEECERLLQAGEAGRVLRLIGPLVQGSAFLHIGGKADPVYLGMLGRAQLEVGNSEAALVTFLDALHRDRSARNQGIVWQLIGKTYLQEGRYTEAATAFETSHWIGGQGNLGALLLAAKAAIRARDYSQGIEHLVFIANSGNDEAPEKTFTELAWAYWKRYCDTERFVGGDDEDVRRACSEIRKVIVGQVGRAGDPYAVRQLVEMAHHPIARAQIIEMLSISDHVAAVIVDKLEAADSYDDLITEAVVSLVPQNPTATDFPPRLRGATQRYIKGSLVNAYAKYGRPAALAFVEKTIRHLFSNTRHPGFWGSLLASNKLAMRTAVLDRLLGHLRHLLIKEPHADSAQLLEYLRNTVQPELVKCMQTGLLGLLDVAYAGREPGSDIRENLALILEHWSTTGLSNLGKAIDYNISIGSLSHSFRVSSFQIKIVAGFLNRLFKNLSDEHSENVRNLALRVEEDDDSILVKIRVSLTDTANLQELKAMANALLNDDLVISWGEATAQLLPHKVKCVFREETRDVLLEVPVWKSSVYNDEWKWFPFYDYVLTTAATSSKAEYYKTARSLMPTFETLSPTAMTRYVLTQLDGEFVKAYSDSFLVSIPHTISNALEQISNARVDTKDLDELARAIQRLYHDLLNMGDLRYEEFDLHSTVINLCSECRVFYPDIIFDSNSTHSKWTAIILGSKDHITLALRDVIHNGVDAIRETRPDRRIIRIEVFASENGFTISVVNTGAKLSAKGTGTGSRTVDRIVALHKGTVRHGGLIDRDPFTYEWSIFLPLSPFPEDQ